MSVEKIELEFIISDVAIRYLGALIFFANLKKKTWLLSAGGYFRIKYKFINQ